MTKTQVFLSKLVVRLFLLALTIFVGFFVYSLIDINAVDLAVCAFTIYMSFTVVFLYEEQELLNTL